MKIAIDAGHGGSDPGAVGPSGVKESEVVLSIAFYLEKILINLGFETLLTRDEEVFVELADRCSVANNWGADYFVSIHCNSDGPSAVGIETLYTSPTGLELAKPVQAAMLAATGDTDRGCKERNDLYVLNGTDCPAILAEVGFISHPATEEELASMEYQGLLAVSIALGTCKFLYNAN